MKILSSKEAYLAFVAEWKRLWKNYSIAVHAERVKDVPDPAKQAKRWGVTEEQAVKAIATASWNAERELVAFCRAATDELDIEARAEIRKQVKDPHVADRMKDTSELTRAIQLRVVVKRLSWELAKAAYKAKAAQAA
jgi:hypothetical protein